MFADADLPRLSACPTEDRRRRWVPPGGNRGPGLERGGGTTLDGPDLSRPIGTFMSQLEPLRSIFASRQPALRCRDLTHDSE